MAVTTPTLLVNLTALTGTEQTLYTGSGSGLTAIIRNIHICNTSGIDRQVNMSKGAFAAATALLYSLTVPANDVLSLDVYIGISGTETLRGYIAGGPTSGITVTVMGVV